MTDIYKEIKEENEKTIKETEELLKLLEKETGNKEDVSEEEKELSQIDP